MELVFPKQIIQGLIQGLANSDAEIDGRIVIPLFHRCDGLPGDTHQVSQGLLGQVLARTRSLEFQILHSLVPHFSKAYLTKREIPSRKKQVAANR